MEFSNWIIHNGHVCRLRNIDYQIMVYDYHDKTFKVLSSDADFEQITMPEFNVGDQVIYEGEITNITEINPDNLYPYNVYHKSIPFDAYVAPHELNKIDY